MLERGRVRNMAWVLKYHHQKLKTGQFILSRMYSKTGQAGSSLPYIGVITLGGVQS